MPATIVTASPLWLDHLGLRALARSIDLSLERDAVEQTVFADSSRSHIAGLRSVSLSATAIADLIQGASPGPPSALDTSVRLVTIGGAGETDGAEIYAFATRTASASFGGSVGDPLEVQIELAAEIAAGGRGLILHPDATRSASGNGTARQFGALADGGRLLFGVHVFSASGTSPQLTVALQSDDASGFASPATVATLGPVSSPQGLYTVVNGPVTDTWWRVTWTISGTSPSFRFSAIIAK